jgi:hypothetical protein
VVIGAIVFLGYCVYGWGAGLLAAWGRRRERTHTLERASSASNPSADRRVSA